MKHLKTFTLALTTLTLALTLFSSCNFGGKKEKSTKAVIQKDGVEVLYFHAKNRCYTCNLIEALTKEVITENFSKEIENGELSFKIIDISTKEGEPIADKFEITWSSVLINKWVDGKVTTANLTEPGFMYASSDPGKYQDLLKAEITTKLAK